MKILRLCFVALLAAVVGTAVAGVKPRGRGARRVRTDVENKDVALLAQLRIGTRESSSMPATGRPYVPVILVQFPDLRFQSGLAKGTQCETEEDVQKVKAYFDLFCNGRRDGGHYSGARSAAAVSEYFRDQSGGLFEPEFVVIGPVTLDRSYTYYGQNSDSRLDVNITSFYYDALVKARGEMEGRWDDFDNNNNGVIDMAFFVFAGEGENALDPVEDPMADYHIWPKENPSGGTYDNRKYGCLACCNETYEGEIDGIGVFVHELSHALGLPDFYDTNYVNYGLDYWDIMDSGDYCKEGQVPCGFSAYEMDFMGWRSMDELSMTEVAHVKLDPLGSGGKAVRVYNPENTNEYFVFENRQSKGWDSFIGNGEGANRAHGMLVTRVDYVVKRWQNNSVNTSPSIPLVQIIPANGKALSYMDVPYPVSYESFMDAMLGVPYPGKEGVTELADERLTVHTTTGVNPGRLGASLYNIVENEDGTVEFDFVPNGLEPPVPDAIEDLAAVQERNAAPVYTLGGQMVRPAGASVVGLPRGIYVKGGKKIVVR